VLLQASATNNPDAVARL